MPWIGEWAVKDDAEWRTELGYDRGLDRARAGLGYTRRFNKLQLTGFGEVATDGSVAASLALAFSFGPRSNGGWRVSSEKLASRGQVIAEVWMDENGDGVRQPGEAAMPDVRSEEHTSEPPVTNAQLVCRLLLEKKNRNK